MSRSNDHDQAAKVAYIILFENGRLGNQFFQYLAARSVAPSAKIIYIGFESLLSTLDPSASSCFAPTIEEIFLSKVFGKLGRERALNIANANKAWGVISENFTGNSSSLYLKPGICKDIAILDGFFQDESIFFGASCNEQPLRKDYLRNARQWIIDNIISRGRTPYFLHLRRGDYVRWPTRDHPAVLPFQWYKKQMNKITETDDRAHFIVCTDDHPYAEEYIELNPRMSIFKGSEIQDFFLMTQCSGGGILSASTYSWWAAWYGRQFFPHSRYIAPQHWAGWRKGKWYPPAIKTSWLDYKEVC